MRNWNDDPFTKKARKENFLARSVFKLEEIDKRDQVLKGAKVVLDLGASPGSWTEYCLRALPKDAQITAVDISPIKVSDPRLTFLEKSVEDLISGAVALDPQFQVVLSDMAPKTSGVHARDVALSLELCEMAFEVAQRLLLPGGNFVVKVFMGEGFEEFHKKVKTAFSSTRLLRPESTRKHSREIYLVAKTKK